MCFQIDPKKRPPFEELESSTSLIYKTLETDSHSRPGKGRRNSTGRNITILPYLLKIFDGGNSVDMYQMEQSGQDLPKVSKPIP